MEIANHLFSIIRLDPMQRHTGWAATSLAPAPRKPAQSHGYHCKKEKNKAMLKQQHF